FLDLVRGRLSRRVASQPLLAGLQKFLRPSVIEVRFRYQGPPMETREILLKADRIVVALERLEDGKTRATAASWDDHKGHPAQSGARDGDRRPAGGAGPRRQADRLPGHRRHGLG